MSERQLATIVYVHGIVPIEGADMIELALVKGWQVVVKKGEFKVGDLATYCEIDSFLPIRPEYEFLAKSSLRKMGDEVGYRLKTIRLRGQVSQGLLLPAVPGYEIDHNVTELLGIKKFEPPIPACLAGVSKGNFPGFIHKTDESRIQNLNREFRVMAGQQFYVTEKLDGSSCTVYNYNGQFGVCSRNLDLVEHESNSFWRVVNQYNLRESLPDGYALQGELIGEGVQGNPYKLAGHRIHFFTLFNIVEQRRESYLTFKTVVEGLGLQTVPLLDAITLPDSIPEILAMAEGKSVLNPNTEREGLVFRSLDCKHSFKAISNKFLLKEKG